MNMTQVVYVLAIVEQGSMNKAAKALYISQSNLSYPVRQLEQELGVSLFERTGTGMELTYYGREFCTFAQAAYKQFKLLNDFCISLNHTPTTHFTVAAQYLDFANFQFVNLCKSGVPKDSYHYSLYQDSFSGVVDLVSARTAELGILVLTAHRRQMALSCFGKNSLTYRMLSENELSVLLRRGTPLIRDMQTASEEPSLWTTPLPPTMTPTSTLPCLPMSQSRKSISRL